MPNHFHAIMEIVGATLVVAQNDVNIQNVVVTPYETVVPNENGEFNTQGQPQGIAPTGKTIGEMVGAFESITAVEYIRGTKTIIGKHSLKNCGNVIIGNTLSEMKNRISKYQNTL